MDDYQQAESKMPTGLRGGSGCDAGNAEHPAMPVFREYCKVKSEFDNLCRTIAAAQQNKSNAEKRLLELSAKIQAMVEDGQYDPTVPRPACDPSMQKHIGQSRY
jgi:hypothetical protein